MRETPSIAEGAVEEGVKEVLGLTQRLALHSTESLQPLNRRHKLLLACERGHRDRHYLQLLAGEVGDRGTRHVVG